MTGSSVSLGGWPALLHCLQSAWQMAVVAPADGVGKRVENNPQTPVSTNSRRGFKCSYSIHLTDSRGTFLSIKRGKLRKTELHFSVSCSSTLCLYLLDDFLNISLPWQMKTTEIFVICLKNMLLLGVISQLSFTVASLVCLLLVWRKSEGKF